RGTTHRLQHGDAGGRNADHSYVRRSGRKWEGGGWSQAMIECFNTRPFYVPVCSMLIVLAGVVCIPILPIAQFPNLSPPQVTVSAVYNGANSQTVETSVTTLLEQAINGAEGIRYISSSSGNDGLSSTTITFDLDRSLDIAAVDVQNRAST